MCGEQAIYRNINAWDFHESGAYLLPHFSFRCSSFNSTFFILEPQLFWSGKLSNDFIQCNRRELSLSVFSFGWCCCQHFPSFSLSLSFPTTLPPSFSLSLSLTHSFPMYVTSFQLNDFCALCLVPYANVKSLVEVEKFLINFTCLFCWLQWKMNVPQSCWLMHTGC